MSKSVTDYSNWSTRKRKNKKQRTRDETTVLPAWKRQEYFDIAWQECFGIEELFHAKYTLARSLRDETERWIQMDWNTNYCGSTNLKASKYDICQRSIQVINNTPNESKGKISTVRSESLLRFYFI